MNHIIRRIRLEGMKLPERSDSAANFLGRFGGRGRRLFLLLVVLELLLLLLLRFCGRLLDRLRRGRLRLARGGLTVYFEELTWKRSNLREVGTHGWRS